MTIEKQALREEFRFMQEHYSDPADRARQVIYIAAEALLYEVEAAEHTAAVDHEAACSLVEENEELKRRIAELEAKLANPVLLPKTNGYWNEQEKAYEEAITLARRQIRLAGFRCELQELHRSCLALRGEIEDVQEQLYEAENRNNADDEELQERRKADSEPAGYHVIKECGKVGCSVATLEEAEKTRDFWNKKWIIKPYFYAPPVQETGVYKDMLNIINLLENNEWAEHCTSTVLGSLLESEITRLVSKEQSAPVVPEEITDESTEQRLMGRRWAHSFCAGWNACRAAMLKGDAK